MSDPLPSVLPINLENIPAQIRGEKRFVVWRAKAKKKIAGKFTKPLYQPANPSACASSTDPATWGTLDEAVAAVEAGQAHGIGLVLGDGLAGVDLDDCRDPQTGEIEPDALEIAREIGSYTEVSPFGGGLHVLALGSVPPGGNRKNIRWSSGREGKIELYDDRHYFTLTGAVLGDYTKLEDRSTEIERVHARIFAPARGGTSVATRAERAHKEGDASPSSSLSDEELVERACEAGNGEKFSALWAGDWEGTYGSQSEADMALASLLAYWTDGDPDRVDRLFRQSGLMRPKWGEKRGEQTYGEMTVARAVESTPDFDPKQSARVIFREGQTPDEAKAKPVEKTDMELSAAFVRDHRENLRFVFDRDVWYTWTGKAWAQDVVGRAREAAKETAKKIGEHAHSASRVRSILFLASTDPAFSIRPEDFDRNPWLFNCENGTLDLRTGDFLEHRRDDLLSKVAPVVFDPKAYAPRFREFIEEILPDPEVRAYVQRFLGYGLTGVIREHVCPVWLGSGRNGKGTLLETVKSLMGDYSWALPSSTLIEQKFSQHSTDITDLEGRRLAFASETGRSAALNEDLIKRLTGGDTLTARRMRQDNASFEPTHKLVIITNERPLIQGADEGIWRRIQEVPFTVTVPPDKEDTSLREKLGHERSGILNWLLEGVAEWRKDGLKPPKAVQDATDKYRSDQDHVGSFLKDATVDDPDGVVSATRLYDVYCKWCEMAGFKPNSSTSFGKDMGRRDGKYPKAKHPRTRRYIYTRIKLSEDGLSLETVQ